MQRAYSLYRALPSSIKLILLLQLLVDISVFLDIGFSRQILGFFYLTFVPGILVLKLIKIDNMKLPRFILFSAGLSISLIMLIGLLINEIWSVMGVPEPLSSSSLTIVMNVFVFISCYMICFKNKDRSLLESHGLSPLMIPFISLPVLSVIGTFLVNYSGNSSLSLLMIAVIPLLVVLAAISKRLFSPDLYPLAIFCIAIALLFHVSLISNYIVGWDVHTEYYVFSLTKSDLRWDKILSIAGRFRTEILSANSMLSVTILPTMYSEILGLSGSYVFKIFYPFVFSLVPLGLYEFWSSQFRTKIGLLGAFISTFLIISIQSFYSFLPPKQMIAEFFYVLLFLLLFDNQMDSWKRNFLFIALSAALVVSHYTTSYLFMLLILLTWLFSFLTSRVFSSSPLVSGETKRISLTQILLVFIMALSWYIYTSSSGVLTGLSGYAQTISTNFLQDLFNPEARGSTVLTGLGLTASPSFLHQIARIFFYATEFFIVVGIIKIVFKRKKEAEPYSEYIVMLSLNAIVLLMTIIIPNLASALRMGRFYHYALIFLAPVCVLGGKATFQFLMKSKKESLALVLTLILVLTPLMLFETEFVYTAAKDESASISVGLNMEMMDPVRLYDEITVEQEVVGALWLSVHTKTTGSIIAGDFVSTYHVLTSYGLISRDRLRVLSNFTLEGYINLNLEKIDSRTYIYLRRLNVVYKILAGERVDRNITEYSLMLSYQNKIYSNLDCEVYNGLAFP